MNEDGGIFTIDAIVLNAVNDLVGVRNAVDDIGAAFLDTVAEESDNESDSDDCIDFVTTTARVHNIVGWLLGWMMDPVWFELLLVGCYLVFWCLPC